MNRTMSAKKTVVLGMLALAALTGCTTGGALVATDPNRATDAALQASPATAPSSYGADKASNCAESGGWYDGAAGVCDDNAP